MNENKKLLKNIKITGKIICLTGLHIGGTSDSSQIGGVDNPVISDPYTKLPYIPGSSLKGKIRSLLELRYNLYNKSDRKKGDVHSCNDENCFVCNLFGRGVTKEEKESQENQENVKFSLPRLIFRDAFPTEDTKNMWSSNEKLLHGTEVKYENTINRLTSKANPRAMERVPKGSEFEFEIIFSVYDESDVEKLLPKLKEGINLLEDNYLGGSGSRGSGKVKFEILKFEEKEAKDYEENNQWKPSNIVW
ncbi:MAG: type III-A CRISPR-associated RAMP protein Csm3 [Candidatus Woesearchaeota archaeon]